MKKLKALLAVLCIVFAACAVMACGSEDSESAKTVVNAPVINSKVYNGEKQAAASQTGHPILGVDKAASIRKDCLQHRAQRHAVFIFRQKNGQCHDSPSLSVDRAQFSFRFPQPRHQHVRQSKAFQLRAGGCCPVARSHKDAAEIGRRAMPFPAQA